MSILEQKVRELEADAKAAERLDGLAVDDWQTIERLAKLDAIEYDKARKDAAKEIGIRPSTLDQAVKEIRGESNPAPGGMDFENVEPWPEPVDGAEILDDLEAAILRHCVMADHAAPAVALWVVMTWLIDSVITAAILAITSPEKRCGKTTLLALIALLVKRPLPGSNISPAATFRAIEKWTPTLLIDEADTFLRANEELRGVLNCGHTRASAFVIRTVGDDHDPQRFSTWGAKAIALIGKLPDTLADRSITVSMRRKLPGEVVEKLRGDPFRDLRRKLARLATDNAQAITDARPDIPESLNDRQADNWEPLFAIADIAGKNWPNKARAAALALNAEDEADSIRTMLLSDMRRLLTKQERLSSTELAQQLAEMEDRPWPEYGRTGKPITPRRIAGLLDPFGIKPGRLTAPGYTRGTRGYEAEKLKDVFSRYLPPAKVSQRHKPNNYGASSDFESVTDSQGVTLPESRKASNGGLRDTVTLQNPPSAEKNSDDEEIEL